VGGYLIQWMVRLTTHHWWGQSNATQYGANHSVIGGGHEISCREDLHTPLFGGKSNIINGGAEYSFIGGGSNNYTIQMITIYSRWIFKYIDSGASYSFLVVVIKYYKLRR
jgi:hypothetical protein